jgi:hypothetical protein
MKSFLGLLTLVGLSLVVWPEFSKSASAVAQTSATAAAIAPSGNESALSSSQFRIPGPLRSFLRMAGISQEITPADVLPLLAWNVSTLGYQGSNRKTEYLILLTRYVTQAKELETFAGTQGVIQVSTCAEAEPLLHILGYRVVSTCGTHDAGLITANAERAFLTIDSGFPVTELEQTLQGGRPFKYALSSTQVPVLFSESGWISAARRNPGESNWDLIDTILGDRTVARLYWALSKMDPETAVFLWRRVGIRKLLAYDAVLDFYGGHICIRQGRVVVPGGPDAESSWAEITGAPPSAPAEFIPRLLSKDKGWLAAYFDVLSSVSSRQQAFFTTAGRLQSFYAALHSSNQRTSATAGVFRPAPWLLLLVRQTQWDSDVEPLVPGGIEVWQETLSAWKDTHRREKIRVKSPEDLLREMFVLSRETEEDGPLQAYLALSELDNRRPLDRRLTHDTARLMCLKFSQFSDQYRVFSEFPELTDSSIRLFLDTAERLGKIPNPVRGDAFGVMQANIGLWQILARQGQIASSQLDDSWQNVTKPFARVRSASQVYEAGRTSLAQLFRAATGKTEVTQDEVVELMAGPQQATVEGSKVHRQLADRIRSVLDSQRLVSLDTLIALGDGLRDKANGKSPDEYLLRLADQLHEFQMPQPIFTANERIEWAPTIYNTHHTDLEMRTNVGEALRSTKISPARVEEARGQLTPFLRDILVGLNYAYYEPPGAQALHNNPLFVRSHDFSGETVEGIWAVWQASQLFGEGSAAGGGAHFVGSLADLPYVLAELEQDFIAPKNVQALIWQELVPSLLTSAVLPRWWNVSTDELHAVALYQRSGEELLSASTQDVEMRGKVVPILSDRLLPRRLEQLEEAISAGRVSDVLTKVTPADTFYLSAEFERRYPGGITSGKASEELQNLRRQHPEQVNWRRLSQDFGVPHPTLNHTYARELLNVPPLPAFSGFASRLLAESWDSSNLYWARLADENGYPPVALNRLVPELTQRMVEKIFATDLEDWPALLRALHETGEDFRNGKMASLASNLTR